MKIHFKTLAVWPDQQPATPVSKRQDARFTSDYAARLDLLEYELGQINAKDVILEAFIAKGSTRADAWPRSEAKSTGPGLILSFTTNGEAREFAADNYRDWKDNLYGIAKTLEALRGIDRWRGRADGKQYAGFSPVLSQKTSAQGTSAAATGAFTSAEGAAAYIAKHSKQQASSILSNSVVMKGAYSEAALKLHPDTGGAHEAFIRLQQAKQMLEKHHEKW